MTLLHSSSFLPDDSHLIRLRKYDRRRCKFHKSPKGFDTWLKWRLCSDVAHLLRRTRHPSFAFKLSYQTQPPNIRLHLLEQRLGNSGDPGPLSELTVLTWVAHFAPPPAPTALRTCVTVAVLNAVCCSDPRVHRSGSYFLVYPHSATQDIHPWIARSVPLVLSHHRHTLRVLFVAGRVLHGWLHARWMRAYGGFEELSVGPAIPHACTWFLLKCTWTKSPSHGI